MTTTTSLSSYEPRLRDYQREGVRTLLESPGPGFILGDDVGLGKTVQSIVATVLSGAYPALCVVRASLIPQWVEAIQKWVEEDADVLHLSRKTSRQEIRDAIRRGVRWFVASYATLRIKEYNNEKERNEEVPNPEVTSIKWGTVILDEAQDVKSWKKPQGRSAYHVTRNAKRVWMLTATPMRNRPTEIWALLRIANRKKFRAFWPFAYKYCFVTHNGFGLEVGPLRPEMADEFAELIAPYFLRRERDEVMDLPPLTEETVPLVLTGRQKKEYLRMEQDFLAVLGEEDNPQILLAENVLSKLMRLRQIATCPEVLDLPAGEKTKWLRENLPDLAKDRKVLLFTSFSSYAKYLGENLKRLKPLVYTGDLSTSERHNRLTLFKKSHRHNVLVGTYGAMGVGLNIQEASVVILLDLPWTPDDVDQAIGRAHRQGQESRVHVINLLATDTVDEKIKEILATKEAMINEAMAKLMLVRRLREGDGIIE